jgi:hypothetical protein
MSERMRSAGRLRARASALTKVSYWSSSRASMASRASSESWSRVNVSTADL